LLAWFQPGSRRAPTRPQRQCLLLRPTDYYEQNVYDPRETKIRAIDDVLVDKSGKVTGFVVGVGGFLGAGEKDVIVPFTAVGSEKNDKWWLTLDEAKDDLQKAVGFTYDKASTTWVLEKK
jgi:PRC-barrel domain